MLIESLLAKIAGAVFKKAAIGSLIGGAATAYEIYSVFDAVADAVDCVDSANDCGDLGVCALQVVSDPLTEAVVERLVGVGTERFVVEKTNSGVYVASSIVPTFKAASLTFPVPSVRVASRPTIYVPSGPRIKIR